MDSFFRTPVIHSFPHYDSGGKSDTTIEREAAKRENANADRLAGEFERLTKLITQKSNEISKIYANNGFAITQEMRKKQAATQHEILTLQTKLSEVYEQLGKAQNLVNIRAQREDAEKEARTHAQMKLNEQRALDQEMATKAIEQAERDKLYKSIEEYNTLLEKYQKAAKWLRHINSKTQIPDGLLDDQWKLTDHELENKELIDAKKWNLQSMYGKHFHDLDSIIKEYDAYRASVAAGKIRSRSPPPTPSRDAAAEVQPQPYSYHPASLAKGAWRRLWGSNDGGGRSNKKGKKKNRRPNKKCTRRHSKKKGTRRH